MDLSLWVELSYLFSSVLFVVGLRRLQSPATARGGNQLAALAMLIAIVATLVENQVLSWTGIVAGMVVGSLIGGLAARTVKMTDMPQLVGIFNGFGGGASALVAAAELVRVQTAGAALALGDGFTIAISCLIGTVTFSGSFIAFGKLQGLVSGNPITFPLQKTFNALLFLTLLVLGASVMGTFGVGGLSALTVFSIFTAMALLLGVLLVIPYRWCGHAGSDLAAQLLLGFGGVRRRFRDRQQRAHHRRRARGCGRAHLDDDHVQGHEPLAGQRGVQRVRRGGRQSRPAQLGRQDGPLRRR